MRYKNWKMYYNMSQPGAEGWVLPLIPFHFTLVQNIKRDPFEQAVGVDQKTAMSIGGALGAPMTAFLYDWNMLPIGQQLWEKELEFVQRVPAAAGAGDLQPHGDPGRDEKGRAPERLIGRKAREVAQRAAQEGRPSCRKRASFRSKSGPVDKETIVSSSGKESVSRRFMLGSLATLPTLPMAAAFLGATRAHAEDAPPLASWNDGPAKQGILDFIRATTDASSKTFVPPEERIATFDQDGTLWVEHPIYTQLVYCLDRVRVVVKEKPHLANVEPFKTVLTGDFEKIGKLTLRDLETIAVVTLTGMPVDDFTAEAKAWIADARDHRWKKLYTELTYQPMQEVLTFFRANGYKTFIVTGGGQDFVRVYSQRVYGIPREQVVGTAGAVRYGYDSAGKPFLAKEPKLLLNDNNAGKPEGIHLEIGRRPRAAFGNSTGDRQMLEYTKAGDGARLSMIVLHDDAKREYAYGPARGLPDTKVGTFTQALYDEAMKDGWLVISMKDDWKRIFAFEPV